MPWFLAYRLYAAIIMKLAYGMDIDSMDNKYIRLSRDAFEAASLTRVPGAFWVEFIPSLKYLPDWIPFVPFRSEGTRLNSSHSGESRMPSSA